MLTYLTRIFRLRFKLNFDLNSNQTITFWSRWGLGLGLDPDPIQQKIEINKCENF